MVSVNQKTIVQNSSPANRLLESKSLNFTLMFTQVGLEQFQYNKLTLAIDRELYNRCRTICELEGLAHDLVVHGFPKQALCIASNIPRIYHIRVELYSKEQEADDRGYPVPARVIFVNVKTLSPTEEAVREALSAYLHEFEIGGYWQPEAEIDEDLLF
ncbi:MAG: hypothetical protein QNJ54_06725 [Prochloraceae cyanobacterium]|nr:hypothetical protein [Prochloraceae cyanobacterium]